MTWFSPDVRLSSTAPKDHWYEAASAASWWNRWGVIIAASPQVPVWSGREVRALRMARRMSVRAFAAHLGVSERMVSKWEAAGTAMRPRPTNQAALDTSLRLADADAKTRFQLAARSSWEARPLAGTAGPTCVLRHSDDGKLMALIPAGIALLGADDVPTWVEGFFMDVYPTTNADYARFVVATGHRLPAHWSGGVPPESMLDHPVVGVNLADARAYAAWAAKDLPTGAQWEKAARGSRGRVLPWGEGGPDVHCNVRESRIRTTTPVHWYDNGVSPYGIADLCGNVWEWCATPDAGGAWQTRGGAYTCPASLITPSSWCSQRPAVARDDLGFRCVLALQPGLELLSV